MRGLDDAQTTAEKGRSPHLQPSGVTHAYEAKPNATALFYEAKPNAMALAYEVLDHWPTAGFVVEEKGPPLIEAASAKTNTNKTGGGDEVFGKAHDTNTSRLALPFSPERTSPASAQSSVIRVYTISDRLRLARLSVEGQEIRRGASFEVMRNGRMIGVIRLRSLWADSGPCASLCEEGWVQWVGGVSLCVGDRLRGASLRECPWGEWVRKAPQQGKDLVWWYALCYTGALSQGQRLRCLREDQHRGYAWIRSLTLQPASGSGQMALVALEGSPVLREGDLWFSLD